MVYSPAMETLDKHFRDMTRAAFQRYGFGYGELLARWPEIVGETLSGFCRPERIKWPRGAGDEAQRRGGTLVIGAAPGRALDLQYEVPRIIERVNAFYGHGALSAVKVAMSQDWLAESSPPPPPNVNSISDQQLAEISDQGLRTALERLGRGIASSPQAK